jgi:hypothetical protein
VVVAWLLGDVPKGLRFLLVSLRTLRRVNDSLELVHSLRADYHGLALANRPVLKKTYAYMSLIRIFPPFFHCRHDHEVSFNSDLLRCEENLYTSQVKDCSERSSRSTQTIAISRHSRAGLMSFSMASGLLKHVGRPSTMQPPHAETMQASWEHFPRHCRLEV